MPDDETVQILIKAKNEAAPAIEAAKIAALNFKEAIQSLNRSTAEGASVADAMKRAIGELSRGLLESDLSAKEQTAAIKDMRQAMTRYIEVVSAGMAPEEAQLAILAQMADAYHEEATAATEAAIATRVASNNTASWYSPLQALVGVMPGWLQWVLGLSAALAPFAAVLASAAVATVSFAAGATGMAALFGGIGLGFGALGAGALALGIHGMGGMSATSGPFAKLKADATTALDALAKSAIPVTTEILKWADQLIPSIEGLGNSILHWFGDRVPSVLQGFNVVIRSLTPDMQAFGKFLSDTFDHVSPQMGSMFTAVIQSVAIPAVEGLINNLVRLSDWFQKELPTLGPVMQQVMGGIGNAIQGVASGWAKLNDWIVKNWKPTTDEAAKDWKNVTDGWKGVDWSGLTNNAHLFGDAIKGIGGAASGATGDFGKLIKSLQEWADNKSFWASLQNDIINALQGLGSVIAGFNALLDRLHIDQPPTNPSTSIPSANYSTSAHARPNNSTQQTTKIVVSLSPGLVGQISGANRRLLSS